MPPYTLALLRACLGNDYDIQLFDPNFNNMTEKEVFNFFREAQPEIVGVSSISTEYLKASKLMDSIIKKALPDSIVIQGGIIPTVMIDRAMKDLNVDYWIIGEGEVRLPKLLAEFRKSKPDLSSFHGLGYWEEGVARINPPDGYINDLNSIPLPDYGNLNLVDYGNKALKYSAGLLPRKFP